MSSPRWKWWASLLTVLLASVCRADEATAKTDEQAVVQTMTQYMNDLAKLKQLVRGLNSTIEQNRGDITLSLERLEEGIANERDMLYNIRSYLFLPGSVTTCECLNIDPEQKAALNANIVSIKGSLDSLKGKVSSASPNCKGLKEIQSEADRQLNYMEMMSLTLNRNCCGDRRDKAQNQRASGLIDVSKSSFQTNMRAPNWIYDGISPGQLRLMYFKQSTKQNITNCPLSTPFSKEGKCIQCNGELPLWSMRLMACVNCQQGFSFNQTSKICASSIGFMQVNAVVHPMREYYKVEIVQPIVGKFVNNNTRSPLRRSQKFERYEVRIRQPIKQEQ